MLNPYPQRLIDLDNIHMSFIVSVSVQYNKIGMTYFSGSAWFFIDNNNKLYIINYI